MYYDHVSEVLNISNNCRWFRTEHKIKEEKRWLSCNCVAGPCADTSEAAQEGGEGSSASISSASTSFLELLCTTTFGP